MKNGIWMMVALSSVAFVGCGSGAASKGDAATLPEVGVVQSDGSVVHARALYQVGSDNETAMNKGIHRFMNNLFMPNAYAATGSVTYQNSGSTNFSINTALFVAGAFTGNTLSLGKVSVATLDDNDLKSCGTGGNQTCTKAVIRVYTANANNISGFVNTADGYGVPVYTSGLNPTSALGLTSANSVQVQSVTIGSTTRRLTLANLPSPTYNVTADFSNGGAGTYSMTYVVEYALLP